MFSLSEYTKIDVGWGFAPDPTGGAYSAPADALAGFKGAASRQEGNEEEGREALGGGEEGKGVERGNGEGRGKGGSWGNSALVVGAQTPLIIVIITQTFNNEIFISASTL